MKASPTLKVLGALLAVTAMSACASEADHRVPSALYPDAARQIHSGLEKGERKAEEKPRYKLKIRYNPAHCRAPDYETKMYGTWTRVVIESPEQVREELSNLFSGETKSDLSFAFVRGKVDGSRRVERVNYPLLDLMGLTQDASLERQD